MTEKQASAHGRFQPLHNGHLEYLLAAKQQCRFLWVGITQISPSQPTAVPGAGDHRARREDNPLTFFERQSLVLAALGEAGVPPDEFAVIPFPIEHPDELQNYLPVTVPVLTTVYDDWNREKIRILEGLGYQVTVMWERETKAVTGSQVRALLASGSDELANFVPRPVLSRLIELDVAARIRALRGYNLSVE